VSLRVMIVEDDPSLAATFGHALTRAGHEVVVATSGEEALLHRGCDVLVADVGLPGLSGLDLVEELHLRGEHPRAVIVSGLPDLEACRRALRLGADEYLCKPFGLDELIRAVEQRPTIAPRQRAVFERTYEASMDSAELAARELAAYALRCAVSPAARARLAGCCAELVENVAQYAYPGGSGGVCIVATIERRQVELTVSDEGVGFDPLDEGLDHLSDCRAAGLARVAALAEDVRIESAPGAGTRVHARFHVARVLFDEEDQIDLSELDWLPPQATRQVLAACDEDPDGASRFVLSPALAVSLGRLLAGPDPRRVLRTALWS
jgi:CheY-like chemotaxis protein